MQLVTKLNIPKHLRQRQEFRKVKICVDREAKITHLNQSTHLVLFHLLPWTLWILFTPAEFCDSCPLGVHCTLDFVPGTETF